MKIREDKMVSVIIPVYNTEKYIRRCLNSILNQTVSDWEAILINDGSSDSSEIICKEFAEQDKRFVLISQTNHGTAHARNVGLEQAKGKYITFVDSDDYVGEGYIQELLKNIMDCDMAVCGYQWINEKDGSILKNSQMGKEQICERNVFLQALFSTEFDYQGYLVNKLFIGDIIRKYNIQFDEDIYYNEDRLFVCRYVMKCEHIALFPNILYYYIQREESAMGNVKKVFTSKAFTELVAFERMIKILEDNHKKASAQCRYSLAHRIIRVLRKLRLDLNTDEVQQLHAYRKKYMKECMISREIGCKEKVRLLMVSLLYQFKL